LDEARKDGWDVYGVEVSQWAVDYAKENYGIDVFYGTLKKAHFPPAQFDVVIVSDTIEHLTDPRRTLSLLRPLLSPNGIIYINTPNIDSLASRVLKARWWGLNQFHLYYFTKRTLRQLLQATGFEVVRWGRYARTFSLSYWLKKIDGYNKKIYTVLCTLVRWLRLKETLITINAGDQIEVIARRKRTMEYLPEIEREATVKEKKKMKVIVVLPAYNASKTLRLTVADIPKDIVDEIILVDDASNDTTVTVARELGLTVFRHDRNRGYGANQKTCYAKALESGADIIVMVHPDYQYDPKAIPAMIEPIQRGEADAVFGSRMLKGGALEGGMPLWKHNCNVIFTALANVILGTYLTEYHSGFRAYSAEVLRSIRFRGNSNNFVFDTEIIIQILLHFFKIDEVPIRTRYFEEASVITRWAGFWYGVRILRTLLKYKLHKRGIIKYAQFE
jgi:SAM-dependent methyltransferase